jgi:adenosylcobinamide-GDP ribazoletransferase
VTGAVRSAAAAVSFLTAVPLGRLVRVDAEDIARGAWLFPVVGGLVGAAAGLLADVASDRVPSLAAGALAVGLAAVLTGGMHLDGLADSADALGAGSRERALEIMRDHAVGTFGTVALILVGVLDAALIGALAEAGDAALVGLAAGAAGRAALLLPALVLPYARAGEGQGRILAGLGVLPVAAAACLACVLALPSGWAGIVGVGAAVAGALAIVLVARTRFGGVTGDVLGATAKLGETGALLAAVIVLA